MVKTGQANPQAGARRFVHLSEDQGGLIQHARFFHFIIKVVTFAGTLTNTGKNGVAAVEFGDVIDKLLDQDGFADAGTAEQADFTAFGNGRDEVDDFDAGFQNFDVAGLVAQRRRLAVDRRVAGKFARPCRQSVRR